MHQNLSRVRPVDLSANEIRIDWYSPIYNMHMYWTKQKPEVISAHIEKFCVKGGTVLDAFCGSGMTGVAALMTGRNAILSDLAPACAFLAGNFTSYCDVAELKIQYREIIEDIRKRTSWLYETSCHLCSAKNVKVNAVIWADDFSCPHCNHVQNLCDRDGHLAITKGSQLKSIKCHACKKSYRKDMKAFVRSRPVFLEVDCDSCRTSGKENSRRLTRADKRWLAEVDSYKIKEFLPIDVRFPAGINTKRCQLRGISRPVDIFSKMNKIFLAKYWDAIQKRREAGTVSECMAEKLKFIATSTMFHASLMRRWLPYRTGVPLKGTLFVPSMSEDVRFSKVLDHQAERVFRGQEALNKISKNASARVKVSSALNLDWIKNSSVDYLYYDPPFGGHINYSELNSVWEAWLGRLTDARDEVIINRVQGKDNDDYAKLLTMAIQEGAKKLKTGGHFTIVFASSDLSVWRSLQGAISSSPLKIVGAPRLLDSSNKTFIQLYSPKAQQCMVSFTFVKQSKTGKGALRDDFINSLEDAIDSVLSASREGIRREDLFDKAVTALFSECYFDSINFDDFLASRYRQRGGKWFLAARNTA